MVFRTIHWISWNITSSRYLYESFSKINSETLENAIIEFLTDTIDLVVNQNVAKDDEALDILAIDGKALKGSGRLYNTENKVPNNQIMNFWGVSNVSFQYTTDLI